MLLQIDWSGHFAKLVEKYLAANHIDTTQFLK